MTRISNKEKFPLDVDIKGDEYLIGTDSNKVTKTYSVSKLKSYILDGEVIDNGGGDDTGGGYDNEDGTFTHVMYAEDIEGKNMTPVKLLTSNFVGYGFNRLVKEPSTVATDYIWMPLTFEKGRDGIDGSNGIDGLDGSEGIEGADGLNGQPTYFHVAYADDENGGGFSQHPFNKKFIGTYSDYTLADSSNPTAYEWVEVKGVDGTKGIAGYNAVDGLTYYLHIAYATSANGSEGFDIEESLNKTFIGILTDLVEADSLVYSDYAWSRILNPNTGIPDGNGTFTWIKYTLSLDGLNPLVDSEVGMKYMGFAFGKTTANETEIIDDYEWHLLYTDPVLLNQNNIIPVIKVNISELTGGVVTEKTIKEYIDTNGILVTEFDNLIFEFVDDNVIKEIDTTLALPLTLVSSAATTANFSWSNGGDDSLVSYKLFYSSSVDGGYEDTTLEAFQLTALTPNTSYQVFLKGFDAYGSWKQSATISFTTAVVYDNSATPVLSYSARTTSSISLNWSIDAAFEPTSYNLYQTHIPIYDDNETITGYTDNVYIGNYTSLATLIGSLESDTEHRFYIVAYRNTIASSPSNILSVNTLAEKVVLTAPVINFISSSASSVSIRIQIPAGEVVNGFNIYYRINGTTTWSRKTADSNLIQSINDLKEFTSYQFYVTSFYDTSVSPDSNVLLSTTLSTKKAGINLSLANVTYKKYEGSQKRRYTSAVWTSPAFAGSILKGTQVRLWIEFSASGNISYRETYSQVYIASQDYASMQAFYNAEIISLGVWGDTWTESYGFNGDGTSFQVTSHRDGTASRDVVTQIFFEVTQGGILEVTDGQPNGTASIKFDLNVKAFGFNATGASKIKIANKLVIMGYTGGIFGSFTDGTVTFIVPIDSNGKYTDYFTFQDSSDVATFTNKATLVASSNGIDSAKTTSTLTHIL